MMRIIGVVAFAALLLTGCNAEGVSNKAAPSETTPAAAKPAAKQSAPQLTFEQIKAAEAERQILLAEKWAEYRNERDEQRTLVAIECLCDEVNGTSAFTTQSGAKVTKEARAYLLKRGKSAVPALIKSCRLPGRREVVANRVRLDQVIDLLATIGDRRAVAPMVELLLRNGGVTRNAQSIAHGIARLGDPDTASLLIEAYPWMGTETQDVILQILGFIDSREQLPTLLSWADKSERDNFYMTYALTGFRDPRCEPIFRKVLTNPRAFGSHYSAVRGLALLGIRDIDLKSISQNGKQHAAGYLEQAQQIKKPPVRYPLRYTTSNDELKQLVATRIKEVRRNLAAGTSEQGLRLELVAPAIIKIGGEEPKFKLMLTNVSRKLKVVLKGRDASDFGWVSPSIEVDVRGPDFRPCQGPGGGRCGNTNPLSKEDYVALRPGQSVDVMHWGHWKLRGASFTRPGSYAIKATYDTKIAGRKDVQRPAGAVQVRLVAPVVVVDVTNW